jgi:hypothetical protein
MARIPSCLERERAPRSRAALPEICALAHVRIRSRVTRGQRRIGHSRKNFLPLNELFLEVW